MLRSCSFRNDGRNAKYVAKLAGIYGKLCPSFVDPKMNQPADFSPSSSLSCLGFQPPELSMPEPPQGQHLSPKQRPLSLTILSAAIRSSDHYQMEDVLSSKETLHMKKLVT